MVAMRNGLTAEAELEAAKRKIAYKHHEEYGHKAIQQLEIAKHHAIAYAANHAKTAPLRKRANYKRYAQGDEHIGMH